jgi:methionyl-tRNA formyltransferase
VVVAYGLILPRAVLDLPRLGCVNIHASLLPRWRGAAPIQRAILAGDVQTGVCIMKMEAGLDTGPVYLQRVVPIGPEDTAGSLHDRLAAEGGSALLTVLGEIQAGHAISTPQPAEGVTYAAKIDKSEAIIDWSQSALEIERKVRAFNPWPIAETRLDGEQLRIYHARALEETSIPAEPAAIGRPAPHASVPTAVSHVARLQVPHRSHSGVSIDRAEPGTIAGIYDGSILVTCGLGTLTLTELQRPGRRPVAARDLINTLQLAGRRLG